MHAFCAAQLYRAGQWDLITIGFSRKNSLKLFYINSLSDRNGFGIGSATSGGQLNPKKD
jgi:hypothetical protein